MIPRKLHIIWIGDRERFPEYQIRSWKDRHPAWETTVWDNERFLRRDWRCAQKMKAVGPRDVRAVVELMRLEILHDEGGVAVDADSFCVTAIPDALLSADAFCCWVDEKARPGVLSTSFVGAVPGNPTIGQLLRDIADEATDASQPFESIVGNLRFTRAWQARGLAGIQVHPSHYFLCAQRAAAGDSVGETVIGLHERARSRAGAGQPVAARRAPEGTPPPQEGPAVSVIIPCYRQAGFLPFAVTSVALQTFADWEIVIVNDGSPDDTSAVAAVLAERLPGRRIRLIEQDNSGLANARNSGVKAARGRFLLPLDADDALDPGFLAKTVAILDADAGAAIAHSDVAVFGARSGVWLTGRPFDVAHLRQENGLAYASLYRREVWERSGGYRSSMSAGYEDWDFWLGAAAAGFRARHIAEPLMLYREKGAESMLVDARRHDASLRAQLVLNHPALFSAESLAQARQRLAAVPLPPRKEATVAREIDLRVRRDAGPTAASIPFRRPEPHQAQPA
jgi:GT2 family glycosyltransferase